MTSRPVSKVARYGDLIVTRYEFEAGQTVPLHTHPRDGAHVTIVAAGSVEVSGPGFGPIKLVAGELYDYRDSEQTHAIVALEGGTVVFNLPKKVLFE